MTHFLAGGSAVLIKKIVKHDNVMNCDWYFVIFIWDSLIGVSATIAIVSGVSVPLAFVSPRHNLHNMGLAGAAPVWR